MGSRPKFKYGNRRKVEQRTARIWRHILSMGKRNIGIPAIRRIKV